uniref:Uncharacterized protein n=1 Tax=Haplochromis burtoni TaxID=8153 RepID=A0A3Q2VX88_HAPBU
KKSVQHLCRRFYYFSTAIVNHWESVQHSSEQPTDAFGEVQFAGFLRLSWSTEPFFVYNILTTHWGLPPPNLVVSVVGGNSAWILTTGLRERLGRCVGQAVRDHAAAASSVSLNKVVALGIAPWGVVEKREQLVNPQGSFPARYYVQNISQDSCSLDNNYQAFLLVDDGSVGRRGGEMGFRARLEEYISHQRTGILGERWHYKIKYYFKNYNTYFDIEANPYSDELKLAVTWNRVDIAKSELFNGDIQWKYEDLEDSMTDALINDKPQFVRLFTENGLNIVDYLTYGKLESLYRSVPDGTLLYQLLQHCLEERLGNMASSQPSSEQQSSSSKVAADNNQSRPRREFTLFEVSFLI